MSLRPVILRGLSKAPHWITNPYYKRKNAYRPALWEEAPFFLIHIPKTAGSSIANALDTPDPGHLLFEELSAAHQRLYATKPCLAVLRDPADRLVSTLNYMHTARARGISNLVAHMRGSSDINTFIRAQHRLGNLAHHYFLRPAARFVRSAQSKGAEVQLARFESFVKAPGAVFAPFGLKIETLPREKVSTTKICSAEEITPQNRALLREVYRDDYALLERL